MRQLRNVLLCCSIFGLFSLTAYAAGDVIPWTLPALFKRVPPLKHDAGGRLPLICANPFVMGPGDHSFADGKPFPGEIIRELMKRGLTPYILPEDKYIPYALALQQAGAKVIMLAGATPMNDTAESRHRLPADFQRDLAQPPYPCPLLEDGWHKTADQLRATFTKFKTAGVSVDAVWLDWDIEPHPGKAQWQEAKACPRCRELFPAGVLDDYTTYCAYITTWRTTLFSTYVVTPILESYPKCSVTNWSEVSSSTALPTPSCWGDHLIPPTDMGRYTAANPIVYGNTIYYRYHWNKEWNWPLDAPHMDRLYTHVMLGQLSRHAANALKSTPEKQVIPWVTRFYAGDPDTKIPALTHQRYREILRHCWLRGADSMQIFNPNWFPDRPDRLVLMTDEVADVVAVYDEMLAFRKFLDHGVVMNTAVPTVQDDGPIWSGLRVGEEAVMRVFTQAAHPVKLSVAPFTSGPKVELLCPPQGATYFLRRSGTKITVMKMPA